MARSSVSDEEVQLRKRARRRLVGAVALVILVVALAPLVLDRAPKSATQHIDVQMPAAGGGSAEASPAGGPANGGAPQSSGAPAPGAEPLAPSHGAGAAEPAGSAPEHTTSSATAATSPAHQATADQPSANSSPAGSSAANRGAGNATPVPPAPNEGPAASAQSEHAAPTASAHSESAPATSAHAESAHASADGYAVPIIATVSVDKARALKQKLQKAKLPVYLEKTPDGGKTRVRVGPFKQKDAAERARQRLVKLGFDPGKVVPKGE